MKKELEKFKYGVPVDKVEMPQPRKRLPEYDECLREFLSSGFSHWEVNVSALPSQKPRVVLSSLKWRIKNKSEFKDIQAIMKNSRIYLTREKQ